MSAPSAKVILDSISSAGHRLTTLEVKMHRFVLAEFNTHRKFSRSSASSRAIPFTKMVERVENDPAIPVSWPTEKSGMQGGEGLEGGDRQKAVRQWLTARDFAVAIAQDTHDLGVHKSVCNRMLEPFAWHTVICSATDWTGFWKQRCSPLAQPEMRAAAEAMKAAYDASTPRDVEGGYWHMPYVLTEDLDWMTERYPGLGWWERSEILRRLSVARSARVSYLNHDGRRDPEKDLELFEKLVTADPPHAAPLEMVARPLLDGEVSHGNFTGWQQLRHDLEMW